MVTYSSDEDDEGPKKATDVNYDDVQMDMSSEDNEDQKEGLFKNKEEYKAYKEQFEGGNNKSKKKKKKNKDKNDDEKVGDEYGAYEPPVKKKHRNHDDEDDRDHKRHDHRDRHYNKYHKRDDDRFL